MSYSPETVFLIKIFSGLGLTNIIWKEAVNFLNSLPGIGEIVGSHINNRKELPDGWSTVPFGSLV